MVHLLCSFADGYNIGLRIASGSDASSGLTQANFGPAFDARLGSHSCARVTHNLHQAQLGKHERVPFASAPLLLQSKKISLYGFKVPPGPFLLMESTVAHYTLSSRRRTYLRQERPRTLDRRSSAGAQSAHLPDKPPGAARPLQHLYPDQLTSLPLLQPIPWCLPAYPFQVGSCPSCT